MHSMIYGSLIQAMFMWMPSLGSLQKVFGDSKAAPLMPGVRKALGEPSRGLRLKRPRNGPCTCERDPKGR